MQQFMKDGQQGTTLIIDDTDLQDAIVPTESVSLMSSLSHPPITDLAQKTRLPPMQNRINTTSLWQQILQNASSAPDLDSLLTELAAILGKAFEVDGCAIVLPIAAQTETVISYWLSSSHRSILPQWPVPLTNALFEQAELIVVSEATNQTHSLEESETQLLTLWRSIQNHNPEAPEIQVALGLRTEHQGSPNGVISLMRSQPHQWTTTEIEDLQRVALPVAIALSQFQARQQLNQQIEYQSVVNQLTMATRSSSDLNQILKLAVEGTAKVLQAQRSMLLRLKYWDPLFRTRNFEQIPKARVTVVHEWLSQTNEPELAASPAIAAAHDTSTTPPNTAFWMSECYLCQQAFIGAPNLITFTDPSHVLEADSLSNVSPLFKLEELPSILLAPLESQGTVLGFLVFQHPDRSTWQPKEIELVELVSAQVSTAIIQAETLRQVQSLVEKRTAELQESLAVQAKLYERTRQQIDQLRHLNQLKDEFLSTVSHELRTPLTSMTMAIRMLRQSGISDDRRSRYLDILEQQCAQETSLINDLLALQELEAKQVPIQPQEINLCDLIQDLTEAFNQRWAAKGLTLRLDLPKQGLRLRSDRDSINRILLELLTNAGKYADPNSTVSLNLGLMPHQSMNDVVLTLCNTGPGISAEELPYIFDKFRRCQGATQNAIQGTGLGLALVKSLVQHLNGTISASSELIEQSQIHRICFTVNLPQVLDYTKA